MVNEKFAHGIALGACLAFALATAGCDGSSSSSGKPATTTAKDGHDHDHADDHDHSHAEGDGHAHAEGDGHDHGHSHGPVRSLGQAAQDGLEFKVSLEGDLKPGAEASFDVQVSPAASAVRAWIGTQDAKGSVRAKAEREGAGWHVHVEAPSPMPEGARLWVEAEKEGGARTVVGFDLPT